MDFLKRIKRSVDLPSTPTAPKMGRIPLPEIDSPVISRSPLGLPDEDVLLVDRHPTSSSPLAPTPRRRTGSVISRGATPQYLVRSTTPAHTTPSPELYAPTPKWQNQRTLLDHDWASCSPTPDPHVLKERARTMSTHSPIPRASSSRHQYHRNTESPEELKKKLRMATPQPQPPRRSSSRYSHQEAPAVEFEKRPLKGILKPSMFRGNGVVHSLTVQLLQHRRRQSAQRPPNFIGSSCHMTNPAARRNCTLTSRFLQILFGTTHRCHLLQFLPRIRTSGLPRCKWA